MLVLKLWLLALSSISLGLPMIERQGGPNNVDSEVQENNTSPLLSGNINLQKSDLYRRATVWTIWNYWSVKTNYEQIRSEEFYESTYGYRMLMVLFLKSFQDRNYLGIFMLLQPGEYDNNLSWPFSKRVTFSVLDQTGNNNHWSLTFDAKEIYDKCPDCFNRHFEKNNKGWGFPTLISHADLESTYNPYLRNGTIQLAKLWLYNYDELLLLYTPQLFMSNCYYPVLYGLPAIERQGGPNNVEFEAQESNISPLLSGNIYLQKSDLYLGATVWTIRNYWNVKANYELIRGEEFYESTYGYRISLVLFLKSFQDRNFLGIFMLLQPGEYDSDLSWPFSKKVTFSVLDQTGNNNHWSLTFDAKEIYEKCPDCFNRHFEKNDNGWGFPTLISHADLESTYNPYLRNDTIQLAVSIQ